VIDGDYKIFTLWYQGWDNLPPVIAECHRSLLRNANGHEVVKLDKTNIAQWWDIPREIKMRLDNGEICFSHFKDLLSCYILSVYGGVWVDAGVFVTRPILASGKKFYTTRYHNRKGQYCDFRYSIAVLGFPKGNILASMLYELLLSYWKKYSMAAHYLFFADIMQVLCDEYPIVEEMLNANDEYCDDFYEFRYLASTPCDSNERIAELISRNTFLSLTYRFPIPEFVDGKPTFYKKVIDACS